MMARRATSLKAMFCAERFGDHGGELLDAQPVEQPRLRVDPVLHRHHGEVRAPGTASGRVQVRRAG
jgi:hypothetical protein